MTNIACPDAVFVYAPDDEREAMLAAAAFEGDTSSVVAIGYLHMLIWPTQEADARRLMSRCTDGLLPIEVTKTMPMIALFGDRRRMQHVIDGEVLANWTEAKRKLPAAPLFLVAIQDSGDNYYFSYTEQLPELARGMGEALAGSILEAEPVRHRQQRRAARTKRRDGTKPKPPVFHIPIGRERGPDGKVIPFEGDAGSPDQVSAMEAWHAMIDRHPATVAAGACVIIGPTTTSFVDYRTKTMVQSRTTKGAWQPSAVSDPESPRDTVPPLPKPEAQP